MPANCIAYVSHILVNERVIPMLVKAAEGVDASERPAALDSNRFVPQQCTLCQCFQAAQDEKCM